MAGMFSKRRAAGMVEPMSLIWRQFRVRTAFNPSKFRDEP